MKYYETHQLEPREKREIEKFGLYCYDLRSADFGGGIATIEKDIIVNRVGSIVLSEPLLIGKDYPIDYVDYETFINMGENVSDFLELVDENKYSDYGKIDLSDDDMIDYEFHNLYSSSDEYEELDNKLTPNEKKQKILYHYHNVDDYALIEETTDIYKLYHIEKEKILEDLER